MEKKEDRGPSGDVRIIDGVVLCHWVWGGIFMYIQYLVSIVHEPEGENWAWEYQHRGKLYHMFLKTTTYKLYIFG